MRRKVELPSIGDRIDVEISDVFLIHGEALEMDVRFDRGLILSSADSHLEIGDAIRREPAGLQARETGEIEVASGKIESKFAPGQFVFRPSQVRRVNGCTPGKRSAVSTGVNVVELKFAAGKAEIAL